MSKDLSENYSFSKWLKEIRELKPSPRTLTLMFGSNAGMFGLLGLVLLWTHWDGISEWWHITHLPWEEVKDTPYRSIWTSGKVIPIILFLFTSGLNATVLFLHLKKQKAEPVERVND